MGQEIDELARFVATTQWEDIPEPVQRHAKLVLLDTVGVILAGGERPEVQALRQRLAGGAGSGATVYARGFPRHDARTAALLNGIAGRAIELCEGLRLVSGQAAVQILPGLFALCESAPASGRELLAALVLGYDVAGRLCTAFTPRPLAHQNGQASLLGAAAAGARLRRHDASGVARALGIAAPLVLTPGYSNVVAGATALNVAGGMSGFAGALVPELLAAGFTSHENAVEEALSALVGEGFRPERVLDGLGTTWHITQNYFRLYACCNPIHPALDALKALLDQLKPRPEEIERIDIATYRFASVMRNPEPPNFFASKYSLPHAAAVMAVRGNRWARRHGRQRLARSGDRRAAPARAYHGGSRDERGRAAAAPRARDARAQGRAEGDARVESHRGDFNQPFEESELRGKFRELAGHVLTREGTLKVEQAIDCCEQYGHGRIRRSHAIAIATGANNTRAAVSRMIQEEHPMFDLIIRSDRVVTPAASGPATSHSGEGAIAAVAAMPAPSMPAPRTG
jgi:2-methylcitrate dehydratase PrpD